ncbi:GspH/FimT family pseudopilin [Variovorax sp. LT2P21]|uniref:GspH/FimT family pseudopilin n=1 Tax=Variovorax sp. LT2P21 TaxID=3443731 RepID=UPI003F49203A
MRPKEALRPFQSTSRKMGGFTAVELMVVIAIVAILGALAAPSFSDVVSRYRVRRAAEDLSRTLSLARTEAIRRGGRILVVPIPSIPNSCIGGSNGAWNCGWMIVSDANGNNSFDTGDTIIQTSNRPTGVSATSSKNVVVLDGWGQINGLGAYSFQLGDSSDPLRFSLKICVNSGGRIRTAEGTQC